MKVAVRKDRHSKAVAALSFQESMGSWFAFCLEQA